jgi:hypothetical protein
MKFFILGDSWGVGEWECQTKINEHTPVPNTGVDFYLRSLGHTVTNVAAGSAGNYGQLRHSYWTLKENHNYDYIVWFHTETIRDIIEHVINDPEEGQRQYPNFSIDKGFKETLHYMNKENYRYAQMIYDEFKIPWIVVGGQSTVDPIINNYSFARYIIPSWLQELLALESTPPANTFLSWNKIERILDYFKIDKRQFILDNAWDLEELEKIQDLAIASADFPDNGHPSRRCFEQLANRIIKVVL